MITRQFRYVVLIAVTCVLCSCIGEPQTIASDTEELAEDQWVAISFKLKRSARVQLSFKLESGPAVDVYLVDQSGMNSWNTIVKKGQSVGNECFKYFPAHSREGLSLDYVTDWGRLKKGTYSLIIDNTDFGGTAPPMNGYDDRAKVSYMVIAK